jgi:diguanylate cyclase (GGDEF)-like protein
MSVSEVFSGAQAMPQPNVRNLAVKSGRDSDGNTPDSPKPMSTFRLVRYFSLTSLVGVLIILAVLLFFYRYFAFHALQNHETRNNEAITRIFANTIWQGYASYVQSASAFPRMKLQQRPEVARIREDVLRQMTGLSIVKVKIYNLDGLTVFSSDPNQVGEEKGTNGGFLMAKAGGTASEITFRDRFDAFEQVINDRSLISSYVPIRRDASAPVEGVMEVYSDVTDYVTELERTKWVIVAGVLGSLSVLYLFLFAIVRRANTIISVQSEEARVAHEVMLRDQALHDTLTGLPNRASFSERLDGMIKTAKRSGEKCAVLNLGLDGFKDINDAVGHAAGDQLLKEVGKRLKECLREADITARIGGDEFAVALSQISGDGGVERIINAAERIRGAVSNVTFAIDGHHLAVTTGIGIAIYPDDGTTMVELMKSADAALYHAKRIGRNNYQFHTADMNARALAMLVMEDDLRRALEEKQFLLHYQPQVDLKTGQIIGAEALVRWRHPERGLVSPAEFIPVAEARGLIVQIGEWVLREACRQNKEWQEAGLPSIPVAVNVSALQFQQNNLSQEVMGILQDCGLAPEYLELELTESALMRDADKTIATMHALKGVGIRLSLDDFGTGYSSLSQLKRLPLDKLKIDQSFVRGLSHDPDDLAISNAIIAMGKALKLQVIAEGVETKAQLEVLQSLKCDEIQGYLVAKPMPSSDFARFVREQRSPWTEHAKAGRSLRVVNNPRVYKMVSTRKENFQSCDPR